MKQPSGNIEKISDVSSPGASKEEGKLVQGLLNKEEWAYRELIERWSGKLYQVAYRFMRNKEEAQEILQEVFRKVLEKIGTFKGESKIYTWLYRITVNEALMKIRAEKNKPQVSWEEVLPRFEEGVIATQGEFSDWSKLSDQKLMEQEAREYLHRSIAELPENYRAPYILKDIEQLSEKEVSDILGISKSVMKIRVHRARMFLRKKMEERYVDHA